jgi:hypothetical protein
MADSIKEALPEGSGRPATAGGESWPEVGSLIFFYQPKIL